MTNFIKCFFILALLLLTTSPAAYSQRELTREQLLQGVKDGIRLPGGVQEVTIGPLLNGTFLSLQVQYGPDLEGFQADKLPNGKYCVSIDRLSSAKAFLLVDASIICARTDSCSSLAPYLSRIAEAKHQDDLILFEVIHTAIAPQLRNWRLTSGEAIPRKGGTDSFVSTIQFHEIGHILLGHLESPAPEASDQQAMHAEADGVAIFTLREANLSNAGGATALLDLLQRQRELRFMDSHPLPSCRIEAMTMDLSKWFAKYRKIVGSQGELPPLARDFDRRYYDNREAVLPFLDASAPCDNYARSFAKGVRVAQSLISSRTEIKVVNKKDESCK